MAYLEEFKTQISSRNFPKFLQLWEEYCAGDQADVEEWIKILQTVKNSDFAKSFGKLVEAGLPLWQTIQDKEDSYRVLKALIEVQTTNTPLLAELVSKALQERYGDQPQFNERMRLVGMRTRENFQGAMTNYDLLNHMENGKFVFHPGGWGTGEIVEVSTVRQQVTVEFENVAGRKHLTFDNAFKNIVPLKNEHFFARRFADPDLLEEEAKKDAVGVIKLLLQDLGPQTASEIKDALSELVIPEKEWTKWWQGTRAKLKKDPLIESPEALRDPFRLRKSELSQQERLQKAIKNKISVDDIIVAAYDFLRDLTDGKKNQEVREVMKEKLIAQLSSSELSPKQELQICICLENQFGYQVPEKSLKELIQQLEDIEDVINAIDIIALKKRALGLIRENRKDWVALFLNLIVTIKHSALRDYMLKELNQGASQKELKGFLQKLLNRPESHPDFFFWYFQKVLTEEEVPFTDKEGQQNFFDSFLILISVVENKAEYRDLVKKMYTFLLAKRYEAIRNLFEGSSLDYVKEFLLLASKCQIFSDHDRKILQSLAAVVHPSLGKEETEDEAHGIIWTTEKGYLKVQQQIQHIGTVEVVENAREVEAARALGDLRENSEYKFAVERRGRLQSQLKVLSDQLKRARIVTKDDVTCAEVGVACIVDVMDSKGRKTTYTILGPWDADPDQNILSFQSKLAQAMLGCKEGETFKFREEQLKVLAINSYLDK
ncbi:MAG: DUF3553 domain-containing protein [Parachlamydiaceae bacterium]|nr:DUF3553 domain-containing protein [Parachlamydiaceae bacterium]